MASQGLAQVLSTIVLVLLARLLAPRQFGIAAMAEVVTAFVITYSDCGLGLALVQRETISDADKSTVFWASVALGTTMAAICVALAPVLAGFYQTPEVKPLLEVVSLSFLFTGLGSTHRSLQFRAMNFRALEIRSMAAGVLGGAATVAVALAGGGAWAIILGDVVAAGVSTVLLVMMAGWMPRLTFSWKSLRELGPYGIRYLGGMTFITMNANADNILVGRVLGRAALGTYNLAYSVILVPISRLASPIAQLLSPAFARLQHDKKAISDNWLRGTRMLLIIFVPLMVTVAVTASDVVHIVFGSKWDRAIPVIRILAPVCILLSVQGFADAVLQAVGAMRTYMRMSALSFGLNLAAFFIGVHWGLTGMAFAFAASTLTFILIYFTLVAHTIETSVFRFLLSLSGVTAAGVGLALVEVAVYQALALTSIGAVPRIAATMLSGIVEFGAVCVLRDRDALLELGRIAARAVPLPQRLIPQALQSG